MLRGRLLLKPRCVRLRRFHQLPAMEKRAAAGQPVPLAEVAEALAPDFTLALPYTAITREITNHRSNDQLIFKLQTLKNTSSVNIVFVLVGLWVLAVFWTVTARGDSCRRRAHSWWKELLPTSETLQVSSP